MDIVTRKAQILRVQTQNPYPELNEVLQEKLNTEVLGVTQSVLEAALCEELQEHLNQLAGERPRRSGYFKRVLDSEYGRIESLSVPKLRHGNRDRDWQILGRYQRGLGSLLNFCLSLYVMGLSLRDLQEALYPLLGAVLSVNAINRITEAAQQQMNQRRTAKITTAVPILLVDGVWVRIQYASGETFEDQAGHVRALRQAEERVVLVAMAIYPDGTREILHYEIAESESQFAWESFFKGLQERGLKLDGVEVVVSDGTNGLPAVLKAWVPQAQHQLCITHKIRAMLRHLGYENLSIQDAQGQTLDLPEAKKLRYTQIKTDAYDIYKTDDWMEAIERLVVFVGTWQSVEPNAIRSFLRDIVLTFNFYDLNPSLYPLVRTTNALERLFREFRNKSDEIGAFPNEDSCLTIFFLVLQRDHTKHDRLKSVAKN
ncbi:transposase [Altericista sp. CCNU0014]|uniref:transposase n=1 Tax=Altericista sp. CCNU0014 TaxID=3082949 RepID=UPI00384E4630